MQSEMSMILEEVNLVASVAKELKNDLKADVRRIETIVEDVETRVKEDSRDNERELKSTVDGIEADMNKLEKALAELDTLLEEVNTLRKEEEEAPEMENMAGEEEEMMGGEYMDDTRKSPTATLDGGSVETGEPAERVVVSGGKPTGSSQAEEEGKVSKAFGNGEFDTLNLSPENIEKAYAQFRAEQMEKLAYDKLQDTFAKRFENEVSHREHLVAKSEYDAQDEISALRQQFSEHRKSLDNGNAEIRKANEAAQEVKVLSLEEVAEMDWSDIHKMVSGNI